MWVRRISRAGSAAETRSISLLRRLGRSRKGNVSAMLALLLVPIVAGLGLAAEASSWYVMQRAAQNAADSAAVAAARNNCNPGATPACATTPTYITEGRAAASQFGFVNATNDTTVVMATCGAGCYQATITRLSPISLLQIVGFNGDAVTGSGTRAQTVSALAQAQRVAGTGYCVTATGTGNAAIEFKGASSLDLTGCDLIAPNGGASCNAHTGDTIRYADVSTAGDGKNCGTERVGTPTVTDNYAALANNLPNSDTSCAGANYNNKYPKANNQDVVGATKLLSGTQTFSAASPKCGDHKLSGNLTVTGNSVLVIENGRLDLAGYTISTAANATLTVIFSGTNVSGQTPDRQIMSSVNGGTADFSAPKTGTWAGVGIYQDPRLNASDMIVKGNNPQFNITGLVYAPNSNVEISGAINHATAGDACLAFWVKTLSINGTASIFANPTRECDRAGLTGLTKVIDNVRLIQ